MNVIEPKQSAANLKSKIHLHTYTNEIKSTHTLQKGRKNQTNARVTMMIVCFMSKAHQLRRISLWVELPFCTMCFGCLLNSSLNVYRAFVFGTRDFVTESLNRMSEMGQWQMIKCRITMAEKSCCCYHCTKWLWGCNFHLNLSTEM